MNQSGCKSAAEPCKIRHYKLFFEKKKTQSEKSNTSDWMFHPLSAYATHYEIFSFYLTDVQLSNPDTKFH